MGFCSFSARLKKINIFVYKVSAIRNLKRAARLICMYILLFAFIRLNTLDSSMLKVFSQSIIIAIKTQHLSRAFFSKETFFLSVRKLNHLHTYRIHAMAHDFVIQKYFRLESSSRCGWIVVGNWGWKKIFILPRRQEQMIKIEKNGRKFRSIFIINFDFISHWEQNCCQRSYVKRITSGQGWQFFKETAVS